MRSWLLLEEGKLKRSSFRSLWNPFEMLRACGLACPLHALLHRSTDRQPSTVQLMLAFLYLFAGAYEPG
jgi:hypothetical protein